ncbi:MAG TPA: CHAT domain-containing protein [Pyrinomonadaceae bacterium]|nr:CHAT domain-containing protein [Pyrinomonadaceae bacterium]
MSAPSSLDELEFYVRQAEKARRAGNFSQALDQYLIILTQRLSALNGEASSDLTAADLVITERAAELAILFGHYKGADNLLAGMASTLESALNFFSADFITVKRIHLAPCFGQLPHVMELLKTISRRIGDVESVPDTNEGLRKWENSCCWDRTTPRDRMVIFSQLYLVLGWLLTSLGQYNQALLLLNRGLEFTGQDAPDLARQVEVHLRLNIASAFLEQGDLASAEAHLDRLTPLIDKHRRPGSYVRAAELRGKLKMLQGDFGAALLQYSEVLAACKDKTFARAELIAMLNLSQVLIFLNFISAAQHLLSSIVSRAKTLNDSDALARAERQLAVARKRSASFEGRAAVTQSKNRREIDTEPPVVQLELSETAEDKSFLSRFEDRTLEFFWQLGAGNLEMASVICDHLIESFGLSDSALVLIRLQVLEGTLAYYTHDFTRAERLLRDSLPVLRELGLGPDLWQAQRILGWCWLRLGVPMGQYQELAANNQRVLATMTASLPPAYQAVYLLNKWTAEEEFIAGEINQLEELRKTIDTKPWFRRPRLRWSLMKRIYHLQRYIERYKDSLSRDSQQDHGQTEAAEPSLLKLLWSHPGDRITLSFLVLPDRVLIIRARRMKLDFQVAEVSRIEIRELVRKWHVLVNSSTGRGAQTPPGIANDDLINDEYLDTLVTAQRNLEPLSMDAAVHRSEEDATSIAATLARHLKIPDLIDGFSPRVRALTIIPHEALVGFPFAAINHEGSYLGERFDISTDVGFVNRPPANKSHIGSKALFVGISSGACEFPKLPGVAREIQELEKWCKERNLPYQLLMDEAATKSSLLRHFNSSSLLHIACHGVFRADQPDASGLVLVTDSHQVEILSLRELSEMDLTGVRHVTLSSCSSADNFILPGRLIIGLPETFRRGGVESVLACLWAIDDRFATAFAVRFCDYLGTHARDEALKLTQLDCLKIKHRNGQLRPLENVAGIDTTNPVYWASYVLCGNHDRLRL